MRMLPRCYPWCITFTHTYHHIMDSNLVFSRMWTEFKKMCSLWQPKKLWDGAKEKIVKLEIRYVKKKPYWNVVWHYRLKDSMVYPPHVFFTTLLTFYFSYSTPPWLLPIQYPSPTCHYISPPLLVTTNLIPLPITTVPSPPITTLPLPTYHYSPHPLHVATVPLQTFSLLYPGDYVYIFDILAWWYAASH